MKDIYSTSISRSTLDECPMAYKNMEDIVNDIGDKNERRAKENISVTERKKSKKRKEWMWKENVLFQECVTSLEECKVLTMEETDKIAEIMQQNFPFIWGRIDWKHVHGAIEIKQEELAQKFSKNTSYYILWDDGEVPFLKSNFERIMKAIDDVLAVSFNTWLLSMDGKEIIEFHHEGRITYGRIS